MAYAAPPPYNQQTNMPYSASNYQQPPAGSYQQVGDTRPPALPPRPENPSTAQDEMLARMIAAGVSDAQIAQILGTSSAIGQQTQNAPAQQLPSVSTQESHGSSALLSQTMQNLHLSGPPQPARVEATSIVDDPRWPFNMSPTQPIIFDQTEVDDTHFSLAPLSGDKSRPMYSIWRREEASRERKALILYHHRDRRYEQKEENIIATAGHDQECSWMRNKGDAEWSKVPPIPNKQIYCYLSDEGAFPGYAYWHMTFHNKRVTGGITATWFLRLVPEGLSEKKIMKHAPCMDDKVIMRVDRADLANDTPRITIMPGWVKNMEQLDELMFSAAFIDSRYTTDAGWHLFCDKHWTVEQLEHCEDLSFLPTTVTCKSIPTWKEGTAEFENQKKAKRKDNMQTALAVGKLILSAGKLGNEVAQYEGVTF